MIQKIHLIERIIFKLQSGAKEFYIRDTIIDWQNDRPNLLDVKNISQNKSNKPFSKKKNIEIVKKYMKKWAFNTTRWNQQALSKLKMNLASG